MAERLNSKVRTATKWSAVTEVVSRLLTPITSMVLARLLAPEAFGVVTTLNMIITFAEIFTDAGFQKYLVQHEFRNEQEKEESTNVAFWSNLFLSLIIWAIIAIFADPLASVVGNPGYGYVLVIACAAIPLEAFSSIQMALYKRDMNFKTLFKVRIIGIFVPLFVTIPCALIFKNFWALVIGHLIQQIINAVLLTALSPWKPRRFYSVDKLKEMLSFTIWSMFEAVSIWLTSYVDVFIVGSMLSQHYLGLYKTSSTIVGEIMGLITATTTPILFSALSRLQDDETQFRELFFKFQKLVGILVLPIGVGIYCYKDLLTTIVLGEQWLEASGFVGLWGLTSAFAIVLSHYASEVYRAKGKPKLSVLAQWLHIIVLWPTMFISVKYGFEVLYTARSIVRFELILVNLVILYVSIGISPWSMLKNVLPAVFSSVLMYGVSKLLLMAGSSVLWQFVSVLICSAAYLVIILLFPKERTIVLNFIRKKI